MFRTHAMNNFETEALQHVNPSTPPFVCIRSNNQPLQKFVVHLQNEVISMQILFVMHDPPN
jgi:hypothetical protein